MLKRIHPTLDEFVVGFVELSIYCSSEMTLPGSRQFELATFLE